MADAKPTPEINKPVTVVLDPDFNRPVCPRNYRSSVGVGPGFKMETGYAGRSWLFGDMQNNMVGKQVGSSILTAFFRSDPGRGYGVYKYDDEGTQAKKGISH